MHDVIVRKLRELSRADLTKIADLGRYAGVAMAGGPDSILFRFKTPEDAETFANRASHYCEAEIIA